MRHLPWLPAVLLIAAACAPAHAGEWSLRLRAPKAGCVFDVDEAPHVFAAVASAAAGDADATLSAEVRDAAGRTLNTVRASLALPAGQTREADLPLGSIGELPHGQYLSMTVTLTVAGQAQAEVTKGFGLLTERAVSTPPEASAFGLLGESGWPLLQRLGVRWVRPNWNWDLRLPDWAARYGMADCPLINEANQFARGEIEEKEYAAFVEESVRRFKGTIRYWQLGNEFDVFHRDGPRAYVESQRVGYEAAKRADPDCIVVGGSITDLQCRKEGWPESLALGLAKYCDLYDFHFYQDLDTTQSLLDYIRDCCRQAGAEKPLWVTETTQVGMFDADDANQADYVFKRFAHLLANGVQVVMWHCYTWPYPFEADKVAATAVVDHSGFARPSLFAFAALSRSLEGARFVRRWEAPEGVYLLEFRRGQAGRLVAWSETGDVAVRLQTPPGELWSGRPDGRRELLQSGGGPLELSLTRSPVVLEAAGPLAPLP